MLWFFVFSSPKFNILNGIEFRDKAIRNCSRQTDISVNYVSAINKIRWKHLTSFANGNGFGYFCRNKSNKVFQEGLPVSMKRLRREIYSMFLNINKGYEFFTAFIADLPLFEKSKQI